MEGTPLERVVNLLSLVGKLQAGVSRLGCAALYAVIRTLSTYDPVSKRCP